MTGFSSVADKAIASTKWVALTEVISKAALPLTTVILARLLSPRDYGLVAIAVMTNAFAQMIWDAGLSRVLIQVEEAKEELINTVFWINVVLAIILYTITLLGAGLIAVGPGACDLHSAGEFGRDGHTLSQSFRVGKNTKV